MKPFGLDQKAIGADFKQARESLGLTLQAVAKESGVAVSHVWNLENGLKEMSLEKFFSLCGVLGIPASQIIADNVAVDQSYFAQRIYPPLKKQWDDGKEGWKTAAVITNYGSGCAVIVCHLLLTPGSEMISASSFDYPTKGMSDAFSALSFRIRNDMGLMERRECLVNILSSPLDALQGLGLMTQNLFFDFLDAINKEKTSTESGAWKPKPQKHLDALLRGKGAMGNFDPQSFGELMREFSEKQMNAIVPSSKKRRKKKSD